MGNINTLCNRMRYWCGTANLGYDQSNRQDFRDGGECDCSSLVIHCLQEAGFDTGSASYTGNMSSELCARGWKRIANDGNPQKGDILLNDVNHVALWLGDCLGQASGDERGKITGGQGGDQTGNETNLRGYYNYPWNCYLRYTGNQSQPTEISTKIAEDGIIGKETILAWQKVLGSQYRDGIVSGQCAQDKKAVCSIDYWYWEFNNGGGSIVVRLWQSLIGANADGYFGVETAKKSQVFLNCNGAALDVDGSFGPASSKELQKWLNSKL